VDVLREIRVKNERTVVAVLTGYGDAPVALQAMALGPIFFIRKPFGVSDILEVLDTVVGAQR
jgi:FixJ family two-component response regulator